MRCRQIPCSLRNREFFRVNREFFRVNREFFGRNREFVFPERFQGEDRRERSSCVPRPRLSRVAWERADAEDCRYRGGSQNRRRNLDTSLQPWTARNRAVSVTGRVRCREIQWESHGKITLSTEAALKRYRWPPH